MSEKHININGEVKHRYNSEGQLIHPTEEGIHKFYKWFGKSTAVDEQGRPRVFYHGTDASFDTFIPQTGKVSTVFGTEDVERQGHFFTPSLDFAKEYTKSGNVMKVYLKMHKPFDMRHGVSDTMYSTAEKHGLNPNWLISNHIDDWERFDGEEGKNFKDFLDSSGHDSAIIFEPHGKESREAHIVFNSKQIKSVHNNGNFDHSKDSINESIEHPMIDVDGVMKHRHNSEGRPIHSTEDGIRNFHKWFGDSKVIDEHGRPLVVYHGTTHGNFDEFNTNNLNGDTLDFNSSIGSHFTESNGVAETFASGLYGKGNSPYVHAVYLKIETPLTKNGKKIVTPQDVKNDTDRYHEENKEYNTKQKAYDEVKHKHMESDEFVHELSNNGVVSAFEWLKGKMGNSTAPTPPNLPVRRNPISEGDLVKKSGISYDKMVNLSPEKRKKHGVSVKNDLIEQGHDGVYYANENENEGWGSHTWIAFHPHQIKSATDNDGSFDHPSKITESTEHPMIDVDGEMKHRHNSNGEPIHHTDEGIRNFHKWFGNSKVIDEHGRPLVVYHGTNAHAYSDGEIEAFHTTPDSGRGAAFFSSNPRLANEYGEKVYHTYLNFKNPLVVDAQNKNWSAISHNSPIEGEATDKFNANRKKRHDETESIFADLHDMFPDEPDHQKNEFKEITGNLKGKSLKVLPGVGDEPLETDAISKIAKNNGFDGVIFKNVDDSPTHDTSYKHEPSNVYGAFHPSQIKSAISNSGEFSHPTKINESTEHPMIDVDGEMKHRHNSNGHPIHHSEEGIRNFHRWFDKSKAVDEHGRPQVFYHGTTKNFHDFDPAKAGQKDHGWYGAGHYFTPDNFTASAYSTYDEHNTTGANVMPVYLKIHNPYKWTQDIQPKKTQEESAEATMNMRNLGYDGVFVENKFATPGHEKFYEAIAFHPHQIKSVSGNTGEFKQGTTNITESAENPEEAIVGNLQTLQDSGRYKITHKEYNDRYRSHEFTVSAHPPRNAVTFHRQQGRNEESWYNPDIAEIHTPHPEDPYPRTYPRLKADSGYRDNIDDEKTHGVLYRGMSQEEFNNIKKTGIIKSHGDYNLEGQEGLTYYSRDPSQSAHYAHGFAPAQHKASGKHNVYVVAVKDPGTDVKIAGTGEDEVGIPHPISVDDILHVHVGKAYASHPGSYTMVKEWGGKYRDGSSFQPNTFVGWKKKEFNEL